MPRRLNSSTVKRASPGRSIRSGPAIRSRSRGLKNPAMGPRASGGITCVASRSSPLKQPFTVSHVIHRTSGLERALHQIERAHERCFGELEPAERVLETGEGDWPGVPRRAPERHVWPEGPPLRRKPEWREFLLHTVLQDLEPWLWRDAHPLDARQNEVGQHTEPAETHRP